MEIKPCQDTVMVAVWQFVVPAQRPDWPGYRPSLSSRKEFGRARIEA